jgi:flavin-dependent dehydrogenase
VAKQPDYVVAGGGPAGMTIARLLAQKGRRVVVVAGERQQNKTRMELLAPAARRTISALGLEPLLQDKSIARACLGIQRPGTQSEYEDFLMHPDRMGYVVDRARFDARLREAALIAGVEILSLHVTGVAVEGDALHVRTAAGARGSVAVSGIVIDATGRTAAIARRKGARLNFRDRMVAELVSEEHDRRERRGTDEAPSWLVYQGTASGWSYRIGGPGGRVQTWHICPAEVRLGNAIRCVDASAAILSRAAGDGWIAVGDSAMSFDPIASQGLFNALSSSLAAAGLLLSDEGLSPRTAQAWSGAVAATFLQTEANHTAIFNHSGYI